MSKQKAGLDNNENGAGRAVVIGAGVAGLLAARVLSERFDRVLLIERDRLPAEAEPRKAVPQGEFPHTLLPAGLTAMETLLPDLREELGAAGAPSYSALGDVRFNLLGRDLPRAALGISSVTASRPLVETTIRQLVLNRGNVDVVEGVEVSELLFDPAGKRVTGVGILDRDTRLESRLGADLVAVATGRAGKLGAWLSANGYESAPEERIEVNVGYARRLLRLPADSLHDKLVIVAPHADRPRGMFLFAQEDGAHTLAICGYGADRPGKDPEAYDEYLASVAAPDVLAAVRAAEPLSEIQTFGYKASVRRHYEKLRRFPAGLVPIGDTLCSFNPLFGQGMSVAALEAVALREVIDEHGTDPGKRWLRRAAKVLAPAWEVSSGADLALPQVEVAAPAPARLIGLYMQRLQRVAADDPEVAAAFMSVGALREPSSSVLRPTTLRRVLRPRDAGGMALWPGEALASDVRRRRVELGGIPTKLRSAGPEHGERATVFLHGNPGSSADFEPLVAAAGRLGPALAWDAPGFGESEPPANFEQSPESHAALLDASIGQLGVERVDLVMHDFGGIWGLLWAAANPGRVASITLINTGVLPGYRWHRLARLWRTPVAGELFMRATSRRGFHRLIQKANPKPLPGPFVDRMYADYDAVTRRAVLDLYRSVDDPAEFGREPVSALAQERIPALVVWGEGDPYLPSSLAPEQRRALPGAAVHVLRGCGHWPFIDAPRKVEELLISFLAGEARAPERVAMSPAPLQN